MCIVEKKISYLYASKQLTVVLKKEIKTLFLRLNTYDLTSNFRIYFSKTAQLSKMPYNDVPLTIQRFERNVLLPEFPGAVPSLNLLEASCLFRQFLKFIKFKSYVNSGSRYFYCFNSFTDN